MATAEFIPQQDPNRRPVFNSVALRRPITTTNLDRLPDDQRPVLHGELAQVLNDTKLEISQSATARAAGRQGLTHRAFGELRTRQIFLGGLHQRVQRRREVIRREQQEQEAAAAKASKTTREAEPLLATGRPLSWHFMQVARQELDPTTYQRLHLTAEMRRGREMAERLEGVV